MNRNHSPGALHAELLKEGCCDQGVCRGIRVRVQQGPADHADDNDGESAPEFLRAVPYHSASSYGTQVGHNLRDGGCVRREFELILQQGRVEILRSVAHEIEAGHEQDEVDEKEPMLAYNNLALRQKGAGKVAL